MAILVVWLLHNAGDDQWFPVAMRQRAHQVAVHPSDELKGYLLWANRFTLAMIGATAEEFVGHCGHHADSALVALGLTLRQRVEVSKFGRGEKHRGRVGASGNAGSTADARGCVERSIGSLLCNQNCIRIRGAACVRADEASGLNDPVKGRAI